jgi:hypothetical protein
MRAIVVFALAVAACSSSPPERLGVEVFAEDTAPVRFVLTMSGGIELRVDAERAFQQPDQSLVFETPATLVVSKGSGEALVTALDATQRVAVQPLGISPSSTERSAVVGRSVQITRPRDAPRLDLAVAKP